MASLNGIDISSYQAGLDLARVPCDFVIVKATQGTNYVNPNCAGHVGQAQALGKLFGVYHYISGVGAVAEANHFIDNCKDWIGKGVFALDWESGSNGAWGDEAYLEQVVRQVKARTGIPPIIYVQSSRYQQVKAVADRQGCGLWIAQYASMAASGYQPTPWNEGAYTCMMRQYSSAGRLTGWDGSLDLNKFYGGRTDWLACAGSGKAAASNEKTTSANDEEDSMKCIIQPDGKNCLWYFDGTKIHKLTHPDQAKALRMVAKECGTSLPTFKLGTAKAPWATRLEQAVK